MRSPSLHLSAHSNHLPSFPRLSRSRHRLPSSVSVAPRQFRPGIPPAGVEFAGTLEDFLREDLSRKYHGLMKYAKITMIQSQQSVLTQFSKGLQATALEALRGGGIDVMLGERVTEVTEREVVLKSGTRVPYGICGETSPRVKPGAHGHVAPPLPHRTAVTPVVFRDT